jgi:PAS domain S-box-containing protein
MKAENKSLRNDDDLRLRAEESLRHTRSKAVAESAENAQRVLHELQVHQIELQMQNDELRRTQQDLEESSERYTHLYDFAPCSYLTLGATGEIREANLTAASLLGVERNQLIGQKFSRFVRRESQDDFFLYGRLVLASGFRQASQLELKSATGTRLVVRIDGIAEENSAGRPPGYRVSLTDITDSKQAEEALQTSEQKLNEFFDNAPIGLQWLGLDGTILRANQAQLSLLGYARENYLGHRFAEFDLEEIVTNDLIAQLAGKETRTIHNIRTRLRHEDGTVRHVLISATSHWDRDQFIHSSIFTRDITQRVELEQELLHISEREHRRIAQDLHDDLGQILTATIHLSTTLQKRLEEKSLSEAAEEARILTLLDHALSQTRSLARGLHPVRPEPNGLMVALEELASRTENFRYYPCRFKCRRPVLIEDNDIATHLYRIAQEAVTNSIKHGKSTSIEIALTQVSNRVVVMVQDNGAGIQDKLPKKGGMGLRIMQYRTGMIGGSLVIQKRPQGGTAVVCSVHLPKAKSPESLNKRP